MQVFDVLKSLETRKLKGTKVGDLLTPERVLLITDDDSRTIFIYFGSKSGLVYAFIARKLAKDLRVYMRGFYSIKEITESDALKSISNAPVSDLGKIPQIIRETTVVSAIPDPTPVPADTISPIDENWREKLDFNNLFLFGTPKVSETLTKVRNAPEIPGLKSEMVLIGNMVYTSTTELTEFLKTRKIEARNTKLGSLPEGKFFLPDYNCRLFIKNGHIEALEYLRSMSQPPKEGKINAPLLYINRIMVERNIDFIQKGFKIPQDEPIEDVIKRAHDNRKIATSSGGNNAK